MEMIKIGAVFSVIRNGASISQTPGKSGIPITRIETIIDNRLDFSRVGFADIIDDRYEVYYLAEGDILMSHINSVTHLGKVGIVEDIDTDVIHGMNLLLLKADSKRAFPKYLYYYFTTTDFKRKLIPITKKSVNQASFNISDLKEIEIPLPSYADQIRIAHLLEKIEVLIADRKRSIELLEELVKAAFYQLFGDPVKNEKGWKKERLNNITKIGTGGTPSRANESEYYNGDTPWVKTTEVNGKYIFNTEEKITERALNDTNCRVYPINTILLAMYGQGKTRGNVGLLKIEAATNQACAAILPSSSLNELFSFHFLRNSYLAIRSLGRGGNQENLNLSIVGNIEIFIPPLDLQDQFASIAQKIEAIKNEQETQVMVMEELYASISQKVFAGGLELSRIPIDEALLPKEIIINQSAIVEDAGKEEDASPIIKEEYVPQPQKGKAGQAEGPKEAPKSSIVKDSKRSSPVSWNTVSYKEVSTYIGQHFGQHYFNTEMLLRYLEEERGIFVHYFTSAEQKKSPQYEQADDFLSFVSGALTGQHTFLQLEQVFYNAETENIPGISFTINDLETLASKTKKERSGIYFRIKDEVTPG
ncbi:restriction endonuclease subunit S [Larkinella rosea]|uniref:Restriction endonuclease subunit S n=1 Tax=Larkinella rosea TaxID=2025312 RepID=A0A3P1BC17_9BACT|nr:restriction endonuclease subunit S [Larkinella rosea]RRA98627.1 restriction endonuclease subunit S [Larkinella rosea]